MKVVVVVNRISEIRHTQTTAMLIASLANHRFDVAIAEAHSFQFLGSQPNDHFRLQTTSIVSGKTLKLVNGPLDSRNVETLAQQEILRQTIELVPGDCLLIRTNPGRDQELSAAHQSFLHFCCAARLKGVRVFNNPFTIPFFACKSSLAILPAEFRPRMLVSRDLDTVMSFIEGANADCVVKPLVGSRGRDVIRVRPDDKSLKQTLTAMLAQRSIIVQDFVPAKELGDKRVLVLNGRILEIEGIVAGIQRTPARGEFRANLHMGGTATPLTLTPSQRRSVEVAAKLLNEHDVSLAGVDLVDDKVIEFNVFSTGGLYDCQRFTGRKFDDHIVRVLLKQDCR